MDEMKIRTSFMKGIISKVVSNIVKKKLGKDVRVVLKDLEVEMDDRARIHLSFDAEMPKHDLELLLVDKLNL